MKKKKPMIICMIINLAIMTMLLAGCTSSSNYQLHNKDGSLNKQYVNDMNDYFKKHPEKNPYG